MVSFVSFSSVAGSSTAVTGTLPVGAAVGDLLIAIAQAHQYTNGGATPITVPAGWTEFDNGLNNTNGFGGITGVLCHKYVEAGDTSWEWTKPAGNGYELCVVILCFAGVKSTDAFHARGFATVTNSGVYTLPYAGLTTTVADCMLIAFGVWQHNFGGVINDLAGWTEKIDMSQAATNFIHMATRDTVADIGAQSAVTFTNGSSATVGPWERLWQIAIAPALPSSPGEARRPAGGLKEFQHLRGWRNLGQ